MKKRFDDEKVVLEEERKAAEIEEVTKAAALIISENAPRAEQKLAKGKKGASARPSADMIAFLRKSRENMKTLISQQEEQRMSFVKSLNDLQLDAAENLGLFGLVRGGDAPSLR